MKGSEKAEELLRQLVDGDTGRDVLRKLSEGHGTQTDDGEAWLAAKSFCDSGYTDAGGRSQGQDMQRWAKWIATRGVDLPDHACAECVPHSEILKTGFQCVYHQAVAALAAKGTK